MYELYPANELASWLGYSALSGLLILGLGALAVRFCREPVYRIRIIQWSFIACLLVPVVQQFGLLPGFALPVPVPTTTTELESTNGGLQGSTSADSDIAENNAALARDESLSSKSLSTGNPITADSGLSVTDVQRTGEFGPDSSARRNFQHPTTIASVLGFLQTAYFVVAAAIVVWWAVGLVLRRRILRHSSPANDHVCRVLRSIAGTGAKRAQLRISETIKSPIMWGHFRPTIVIPKSHAEHPESLELRWELAHEWCHVLRLDFLTHQLAAVTKCVCFFQPAYWWLKRELTLSQDLLADAFAARHGDAEDYAAFLVSLAKDRQLAVAPVGLGISDGRSSLFKRIRILLQPPRPFLQTSGRGPAVTIAAVALIVIAGFGSVRLSAIAANAPGDAVVVENATEKLQDDVGRDEAAMPETVSVDHPDVEPITYVGRVIDRESGEPIAGATVQIRRELSRDPKTGKWILLEMTEHESDVNGNYRFTLPPDQVAEPSLYLEVNAHHPNYQSKGWSGYSHTMIRTNLEKGDPPFYATIKLSAGEAITGVATGPDGTPIPGVQVSSYSKGLPGKDDDRMSFMLRGAFQYAETDEDGRFRLVVATPGDGVFWIHPVDFASEAHRIGDKRGDLGTFKLNEGIVLTGRVLDAKGSPVSDLGVNLRRKGDGEEADAFLNSNAVANGIRAGATTDENGHFKLKPLPPGTYTAEIEEAASDPTVKRGNWFEQRKEKMKHVFARMDFEFSADTKPEPVIIQATPHVVIRGRFFDGEGKPRASHAQNFFGRFNNTFFFTESTLPGDDGWFEFRVPHGVTEAQVDTMTNEHSSLRWKLKDMPELSYGRRIPLGTLEADVEGLEIVRYTAPILLVKAVDPEDNPVEDFRVFSSYKKPPVQMDGMDQQTRYREGDVSFEKQADGRWRSSQLLPDAEVAIELKKDGYQTEPQVVSLKEKETRELTFVLSKSAEAAIAEMSDDSAITGTASIVDKEK